MKTTIPDTISTAEEATEYLANLHRNGEAYHPDDLAESISWRCKEPPTPEECKKMNAAMDQIFEIEGFDPYSVLLELSNNEL